MRLRSIAIVSFLTVLAFASITNVYGGDVVTTAIIPNQYIVQVKGGINLEAFIADLEKIISSLLPLSSLFKVINILEVGDFLGFVVQTTVVALLEAVLQGLGGDCTIEPDVSFQLTFNVANLNKKKRSFKRSVQTSTSSKITTQANSDWNLARISERQLNTKEMEYSYYSGGGCVSNSVCLVSTKYGVTFTATVDFSAGSDIYIVDDGVDIHHTDFAGRAKWGYSVFNNTPNSGTGHSTLVAGVAAGTSVGVAKKANIISVEVINSNGGGSVSGIIEGIGWITKNARHNYSVINMSFNLPTSYAGINTLNNAISAAVGLGFPVFTCAGDSAANACTGVPAGNSNVFTVASTNSTDYPDPNSNSGKCVSMYAPGVNIITDWISTNSAQAMISGSSYAAPHASGVAALFLAQQTFSPSNLYSAMKKYATSNVLHNLPKSTPNLLLYNQL
ncbi:peptidase S8/S53 domain-containing protein [Endogone sp. FLAS-F59071]|nr:peptidase S8/S53 domain-containing protein [Endogone sp. FLAS-F59071]|eukprot:RUS16571.1 peptidase S8/S53 domain-containing protein [Endogone sp. FLAS-F59071]